MKKSFGASNNPSSAFALGVDRVKQAAAWLKDGLRTSVHFHPVVVMEADLRMLRGKKLTVL